MLRALPPALAVCFVLAAEALCGRFGLEAERRLVIRAATVSTTVLFLAIRRAWLHDRTGLECVGFAALSPLVFLAGSVLPVGLRVLPALTLGSALPIYTAWRFLPDEGQAGPWWPIHHGLRRGLAPLAVLALGVACLPA